MPKATVIVPVYNVETYLEKCVRSVLSQTEPDFEVLLIDDGSTDGSGALCDRLAQSDGRVRVIHQENQGLGGARNTGIRAARGDWLLLVDSDDWIEPQLLEKALEAGQGQEADLVMFGYRSVDQEGRVLQTFVEDVPKGQALSLSQRPDLLLTAPSACCRLYRRSLLEETGILFPPRVWYEDMRTTPKLLCKARQVVFLDFVGYNYFQRTGSITKNQNALRNREILDAFEDLLSWFKQEGLFSAYQNELCFLAVYHAYLTASVRVLRIDRRHPLLREFRRRLEGWFPQWKSCPYLSRLGRGHRLLLSLLTKGLYGAVALLFAVKDRLG